MAAMDDVARLAALWALEDAELDVEQQRVRRRVHHEDALEDLSDNMFVKIYRLTKPLTRNLIERLQPQLIHPTRVGALSIEAKVLTTLHFYASGSYQTDVGLNYFNGMSQPSVSRAVEEVTEVICNELFNETVALPANFNEVRCARAGFYDEYHIPGVIGCIDCTHIAIVPPEQDVEYMYVNRKGYHSLNTQLICDKDLKIMHVCARYPGSTHDSFIWQNSTAYTYMQQLHERGAQDYFLLGDSGYPLRTWVMAPVEHADPGSPEERCNIAHKQCRSTLERCNGILKMRFRCLFKDRILHYSSEKCCRIIKACTVLHNLCIMNNVFLPEEENEENADFGMFNIENAQVPVNNGRINLVANRELLAGREFRLRLIRNRF